MVYSTELQCQFQDTLSITLPKKRTNCDRKHYSKPDLGYGEMKARTAAPALPGVNGHHSTARSARDHSRHDVNFNESLAYACFPPT
jgi:hypothetical protein